jgi:hypothetical protein
MGAIIIRTRTKSNLKLLKDLATKLGENVQILNEEQAEDLAFGEMMQEAKTGTFVTREAIMQALNTKL